MSTFFGPVATGVVLFSLLVGCGSHIAGPGVLRDALRRHRTLPRRLIPWAAAALPAVEGLLGVAGVVALVSGGRTALVLVLAASAALFGGYAGYLRHVLASGRGGPCGCHRTDIPLSGWAAGRALTYALLAVAGALLAGSARPPFGDPAELATVTLATLTFTGLLWFLPLALHNPAEGDAAP
ncbi:methylamine utilization protein MauE [Streptomyces sp. AJS327]|uniref:MauE/DoxX family redox-associated membrane protein n=1 Tax=Streptomyces sp. AJS327 TaxID=2545265 RepID=UPI0015DE480E|nr:MauE/DoxX family redox-associated membrane protein [Streptomyces sp. AJS327]MBA0050062.1 methylamine utilization protein MauE [Streptomyces sp. AJS327]